MPAPLPDTTPFEPSDYVVDMNGNQKRKISADVARHKPLMERIVEAQENQVRKCSAQLENMRINLVQSRVALSALDRRDEEERTDSDDVQPL